MTMLRARPWQIAQNLQEKLGLKIIAANDGMEIDLDEYRKQKKN